MTDQHVIFACPEHAPAGAQPESNDDGRPACSSCGRSTYAVKPYRVRSLVDERGYYVTDSGERRDLLSASS